MPTCFGEKKPAQVALAVLALSAPHVDFPEKGMDELIRIESVSMHALVRVGFGAVLRKFFDPRLPTLQLSSASALASNFRFAVLPVDSSVCCWKYPSSAEVPFKKIANKRFGIFSNSENHKISFNLISASLVSRLSWFSTSLDEAIFLKASKSEASL